MSDDWRVEADLLDPDGVPVVLRGIKEWALAEDVEDTLAERLPVSSSESRIFVYAGARDQAERALTTVREVLDRAGLRSEVSLTRWHPEAEEWRDASVPLPRTSAEHEAEHARLEAREAHESGERGPQWEVRIDLPSRADAVRVAEDLERDDIPALRRWRHVFVAAATEDEAATLAEHVGSTLPTGAVVSVEGTADDAWNATHRFALLGGLGG